MSFAPLLPPSPPARFHFPFPWPSWTQSGGVFLNPYRPMHDYPPAKELQAGLPCGCSSTTTQDATDDALPSEQGPCPKTSGAFFDPVAPGCSPASASGDSPAPPRGGCGPSPEGPFPVPCYSPTMLDSGLVAYLPRMGAGVQTFGVPILRAAETKPRWSPPADFPRST